MTIEFERERIEHGLRATSGMSAEAKEAMDADMAAQSDWQGRCSRCNTVLSGSVEEIMTHKCGGGDE